MPGSCHCQAGCGNEVVSSSPCPSLGADASPACAPVSACRQGKADPRLLPPVSTRRAALPSPVPPVACAGAVTPTALQDEARCLLLLMLSLPLLPLKHVA